MKDITLWFKEIQGNKFSEKIRMTVVFKARFAVIFIL